MWIPLLVLSIFLQLVGIATLVGIHYYQMKPTDSLFGAWQYSYELSEKAALDTWKKDTNYYNQGGSIKSPPPVQKTFGEFRVRVVSQKDQNGKVVIESESNINDSAVGSLYINGRIYDAQFNSKTREIIYDAGRSFERRNWQWYDWMGFRSPFLLGIIQLFDPSFGKLQSVISNQ